MGNEKKINNFYKWIIKYKKEDNRFGDLARDMVADSEFPKKIWINGQRDLEKKCIERYFENTNICDNAYKTFLDAFYQYESDLIKNWNIKND